MRKAFDWFVNRFGVVLLMTLFWLGFSSKITLSVLLTGFFLSILIKNIADYIFKDIYHFYVDVYFVIGYFIYLKNLFIQIFKNAFMLIPIIFFKKDSPMMFNIHLTTKDPLVVTLIANAITLTPGTITVEITDERVLTVLSITDDGQDGRLLAQSILKYFQQPFHRAIYRMEDK